MREGIADLLAVVRCWRMALALPTAARSAFADSEEAMSHFRGVITPIVEDIYPSPEKRREITISLNVTSMTVNFVVANYARMAGLPFDAELSVLGGAFARLYDDMIDNIDDAAMDERLAGLFRGDGIEPATDSERLLSRLHAAIDERLARPADAPIHGMLLALHEHQLASRGQRDPGISRDDLGKITRGKGGLANVTLLALVQPRMSTEERELIMELGEAFQLLDDYLDQDEDRRDGIFTPITRGEATLADVGARMRALRPKLAAHYGAGPVRPFLSMLFLMMGAICVKRHWLPDRVRRRPTRARKPKAAIWSLVGDAEAATPRRP